MIAEYQIREWLARYLGKNISLDQFEDWFVQHSWNMHKDSDGVAQKMASAIELRLAEHSSGHLEEKQLREELAPLVTSYSATVYFGQVDGSVAVRADAQNNSPTPRVFVVRETESPSFQPIFDTQPGAVCA